MREFSPSFTGDYMGGVGVFFLCRKDPWGNTAPPPPNILKKLMQYSLRDDFQSIELWYFIYKSVWGLSLKGAVFLWFGNCFLVTFEEFQPPCNRKSRDLTGKHSETILLWQIASSCFMYQRRYWWHWVIWFHSILIFLTPPYFSVLSLSPHLLLCPSHSFQPHPQSSTLPSYIYPVHPSSPRSSADCCGRHWTHRRKPRYLSPSSTRYGGSRVY